jgi:hypothetical protein
MQDNNGKLERPCVLVRAWGDKPVQLVLHRIENNRCYVGNAATLFPIALPQNQVFVFDVDRFASLSTAFQQGDQRKLGEIWANISVDDLACNRYQDMLESIHDKEHLNDTVCAPRGNAQ